MNDNNIIQEYKTKLEAMEKVFKFLPPPSEKPRTVPAIFGKSYDENFISDFLAYILALQRNLWT